MSKTYTREELRTLFGINTPPLKNKKEAPAEKTELDKKWEEMMSLYYCDDEPEFDPYEKDEEEDMVVENMKEDYPPEPDNIANLDELIYLGII